MNLPLTNGALLIDNSFLEDFTTCPRKAEYRWMTKRIPTGTRDALNYGTAIHKALEHRYKQWNNASPTLEQRQELTHVLHEYFSVNPASDEDWRSVDFADETITEYLKRYNVEEFRLICDKDEKPMAELSFALPLFTASIIINSYTKVNDYEALGVSKANIVYIGDEPESQTPHWRVVFPVIYTGRIDLVVLWDNQLGVVDHKTAGQLGDKFTDQHRVSPQFEGYAWALQQLTGYEPSFFMVDGIRTKSKPLKPVGGWDKWWSDSFIRHKEYIRPGQLEEWRTNTIALIEEFLYNVSKQYMPMKKKACTLYGKCPYYDVCYLPKEQRAGELNSDRFTTQSWSPLKKTESGGVVQEEGSFVENLPYMNS